MKIFSTTRLIVVALLSLFLHLWKKEADQSISHTKNTLVINLGLIPHELNPHFIRGSRDYFMAAHLYEGLFRLGTKGSIQPGLAEQVSITDDGLHYRVILRSSCWSDGTPLTAHDFVRSWRSVIQPSSRFPTFGFHFNWIAGVDHFDIASSDWSNVSFLAEDEHTLVFSLKQRVPYFLQLLALPVFFPVHHTQKCMGQISNGPFRMKSFDGLNEIILEKNPFFWDSPSVQLNEIKAVFIEEQTQLSLFEKGEIDFIGSYFVPLHTEEIINRLACSNRLVEENDLSVVYIRVNTSAKGLCSRKVRQALSMGLNRQTLSDLSSGLIPPAYRYLPFGISSGKSNNFLKESVTEARRLLKEGLEESDLSHSSFDEIHLCCLSFCKSLAEAIQQQFLENLELKIKIDLLDLPDFFRRISTGNFHLALSRFISGYADPYSFFDVFFEKENFGGWSSSELQSLFQNGLSSNEEQRSLCVDDMEQIILKELPVIPFSFGYSAYAIQPGLKGVLTNGLLTVDCSRAYWEK